MYKVYTDGSYQEKIKAGGYAAIITKDDKVVKKLYQGYKNTTNNRMEMMAVLAVLEYFKEPQDIEIFSDSQYVVSGITTGAAERWFKENDLSKKNLDLWHEILDLLEKHNVQFHWVKGHNHCYYNELADMYCVHAARCLNIPTDLKYVYSKTNKSGESLLPESEAQ